MALRARKGGGRTFGWHSGSMTCKDAYILGDLTIQDDIIFGDCSAGKLAVTGGIEIPTTTSAAAIDIGTATTGITFTGGYTTAAIQLGTSSSKMTLAEHGDHAIDINTTCASTSGSSSVRPLHMITTMTGAGGVGGRAEFQMTTAVKLGGWCNALKGYATFTDDTGEVTGLASSVCAEMDLPNKSMTGGAYYPMEIEITPGASTVTQGTGTGNNVGFIYAKVNTNTADFLDHGFVMSLQGLGSAAEGHIFDTCVAPAASHALKILIGTTNYYILLQSNVDAS